MPWHIESEKDGIYVVNDETGKKMNKKPHANRKQAKAHLQALYANVPEASKKEQSYDQILGGIRDDIRIQLRQQYPSHQDQQVLPSDVVEYWVYGVYPGYAILAKGDEYFRLNYSFDQNSEVVCEFPPEEVEMGWLPKAGDFIAKEIKEMRRLKRGNIMGLAEHLSKKFGGDPDYFTKCVVSEELTRPRKNKPPYTEEQRSAICAKAHKLALGYWPGEKPAKKKEIKERQKFTVFKDKSGDWRWLLLSSNAYRDLDGEIVALKALQDDVNRSDRTGDRGPLRWWHIPGADIGKCDYRAVMGKFLVESGTFDNPKIGQAVKDKESDLQVSIGFNHPASEPDRARVFHNISIFERSLIPVPPGMAANPFTQVRVSVKGESNMASIKDKIKALQALLGDAELTKSILAQVDAKSKEAEVAGVATALKAGDEKVVEETTETWEQVIESLKQDDKPADAEVEEKLEDAELLTEEVEEDEGDEEEEAEIGKEKSSKSDGSDTNVEYLGDITVKEFGDLMADILQTVLAPVIQSKVPQQPSQPLPAKTDSESKTKESELDQRVTDQAKIIKNLVAKVKELSDEVPKGAKKYIATDPETDDNIATEKEVAAAGPSPDPVSGFMNFVVGGNTPQLGA